MPEEKKEMKNYTIGELEEATGMRRRTIHYYIKEGLIAGPTGQGINARYGADHVVKLKLVKQLKETTHWRLEGIREFLDALTLEAAAELIRTSPSTGDIGDPDAEESGERHTTSDTRERQSASDTWERVRISDEIEVHYKQSPGGGMDMSRKIRSLLAFARKLFGK